MSKWILPSHDGTSPSDQVTRQPLVVRVNGEIGSEQAHSVAKRFEGEISQFYVAQVQKRALSALPVYGAHAAGPGIEMHYRYNYGLEYLDVRVSDEVTTGKLSEVEDFWDYALVELALPSCYTAQRGNYLICYAHLTVPREAVLTDASVWPADGVASNLRTRTTLDPIINAADSASTFLPISVTGDPGIASFIVDLRQSRGGAATLDLYPYLYCSDEIIPFGVLQWAAYGYIVEDPSGTMGPVHADVQPPYPSLDRFNWGDPPLSVVTSGPIPTTHFDHAALIWVFDTNGTDSLVYDNGYFYDGWARPFTASNPTSTPLYTPGMRSNSDMYMPGDPLFANNPWHRTHNWWFWHIFLNTDYTPPYSGPNPVPGQLNITLFKGVPLFAALQDNLKNFRRWGDPTGRAFAPMMRIDTTVPAYSNTTYPTPGPPPRLDDFYNIPLRGNLMLDTHRLIRGRPDIITRVGWKAA